VWISPSAELFMDQPSILWSWMNEIR
jgi:hypothetical protein